MSKDLNEALRRMMEDDASTNVVPSPKPRGSAPAVKTSAPLGGGSGGGGVFPLTEPSYAAREWHPPTLITSTDGLITLRIKPIKSVTFTDATGKPAALIFAVPE